MLIYWYRASVEFVTTENNQRQMTIDVYEGERSMVKDNHLLGLFEMTNLTPAGRGEVNIGVTFAIDANGILQVTAEDRAQKNVKTITVQSDGRLDQADIDRMIQEATQFAQQDEQTRARVEARNKLESFVWNVHSTLNDADDEGTTTAAMSEDAKDLIDTVEDIMEWLEKQQDTADKEDFDMKYVELDTLSRPILSKLQRRAREQKNGDDDGDDEL
jgi:heat shock protein 5